MKTWMFTFLVWLMYAGISPAIQTWTRCVKNVRYGFGDE
jgi:hypothetical protein